MFITKQQVLTLGWYHPTSSSKTNRFSKMVLFLKAKQKFAINYFTKALLNNFANNNTYQIITVPSHDPHFQNGITMLAKNLCKQSDKFIDITAAVKRIQFVDSFCKTNNRNSIILINSIKIDKSLVKGANILLLDDISTSGTSLLTIEKMLIAAGAASVTLMALAQTIPSVKFS